MSELWHWFLSQIVAEFPIWLTYVVGITGALEGWRWWRERRWRGWTVVVVRPDGKESEPMRLAPEEVRNIELSDLERLRWIKSLVSNFGRVQDLTPREILDAPWLRVERDRRCYVLSLGEAVEAGHLRLHAGDPALAGDASRPRTATAAQGP